MAPSTTKKLTLAADLPSLDKVPLAASVNLRNTYIAALSSLVYIVVLGMVTSYSAPATVDMKKPGSRFRNVTADEITWIASLPPLTGVIGNCVSGYISHKLGRKAVLMYVSTSYVIAWLVIAYAPSISVIYFGRLMCGLCAGICSVAIPAYIVEISTVETRGMLAAGFQVAFSLGVFIVMCLGIVLRWSWLAVSGAMFIACGAGLMYIMPESPPWLIRKSMNPEAVRGLKFLKGRNVDSSKEVQEIIDNLAEQPKDKIVLRELLHPTIYKPVAIAILLMLFQQFSGVSALLSYTVEIFQSTGSSLDPNVASVIVALVQVLATVVSSLLMDRVGRRVLYITSGSFMTLGLVALGLYSYMSDSRGVNLSNVGWIPLVSFMTYTAAFAVGYGPIPFVMTPEMVPLRYRSALLAVASVSSSFFGFIATKTFDDLKIALHDYGLFWTYGVFTFSGCIYCWFYIPETKGKTIQQIHKSFSVDRS